MTRLCRDPRETTQIILTLWNYEDYHLKYDKIWLSVLSREDVYVRMSNRITKYI